MVVGFGSGRRRVWGGRKASGVAVRLLTDRVELTSELSKALVRRGFTLGHNRGRVLADLAAMIADGGEAIADIDVLRHQQGVLGDVASPATGWRCMDELSTGRSEKVQVARAKTRRRVWTLLAASPTGIPASKVAGTDLWPVIVLDVDATIVIAHSEKDQ